MKNNTLKIIPTVLSYLLILNVCPVSSDSGKDPFFKSRHDMVENDLKARDINDPAVLKAMEKVKRHIFVDKSMQGSAYGDYPMPIGQRQTISQPYIVALMTQSLRLTKKDNVLEIGTGSGYQAAVLAEIVNHVYSIEIKPELAHKAKKLLKSLGYKNITVKAGDGFYGWKEHAPFDAIILTCSVEEIPLPLAGQLKDGGKIIMPLGEKFWIQSLVIGTKKGEDIEIKNLIPVRFVPMTGKAEQKK